MATLRNLTIKLAKDLQGKKLAIFAGAGISLNSGLPIVNNLLATVYSKLGVATTDAALLLKSPLPFEAIMATFRDEEGIDTLTKVFEEGEPCSNHFFIAKLAKTGLTSFICTTNFDTLIESALQQEGVNFIVYTPNKELPPIDWESDIVKVIKIHGCISNKKELAVTMKEVASSLYYTDREVIVKQLFSLGSHEAVIVLGYSCSDSFDITPQIENLGNSNKEVHFIDHTQRAVIEAIKVEKINKKESKNPFKLFTYGKRYFVNTDCLVKSLWELILTDHYSLTSAHVCYWKKYVDEWADYLTFSEGAIKSHIAARLFYDIGEFNLSIFYNKKAADIARGCDNSMQLSSTLGNLSLGYRALGKYKEAEETLNESIPLCRVAGNESGLASQLHGLARVHHLIGKLSQSYEEYNGALFLSKKLEDPDAITCVLGDFAALQNVLGEYENAIANLQKALYISTRIGNKQAESSQQAELAKAYAMTGNVAAALALMDEAIKTKKIIGDEKGECTCYLSFSSIYSMLRKPYKARESATKCILLARKIGAWDLETSATLLLEN
jgi:tetratricopeptide (TPR) repeat protein